MKALKLEEFYKLHSKFYDFTRQFFLFDRQKAVDFLDVKPNDKVIDLACGTGLNIPLLLKRTTPAKIIGIDYSRSMLAIARRKYPGVRFIEGDVSAYEFHEKVDKIICTYSLSMIDEWEKAISNAIQALKEGGTLVVLDFHPWRGIFKVFYPFFKWWLGKHGVYPEKQITSLLRNHFRDVEEKVLHSGYSFIVVAKHPLSLR